MSEREIEGYVTTVTMPEFRTVWVPKPSRGPVPNVPEKWEVQMTPLSDAEREQFLRQHGHPIYRDSL